MRGTVSFARFFTHVLFVAVAFGSALAGGFWLTAPLQGLGLDAESAVVQVVLLHCALFMAVWLVATLWLSTRWGILPRRGTTARRTLLRVEPVMCAS